MAIFQPSGWDYLAQALGQGHESFGRERTRRDELTQRDRQNEMALLQLVMQGRQQGLFGADEANAQVSGLRHIPAPRFTETIGDRKDAILSQILAPQTVTGAQSGSVPGFGTLPLPQISQPGAQVTDLQRAIVGAPTRAQQQVEALQPKAVQGQIDLAGAQRGQIAAQTGAFNAPLAEAGRMAENLKNVQALGASFGAQAIELNGGINALGSTASTRKITQALDNAVETYAKNNGLGPEAVEALRRGAHDQLLQSQTDYEKMRSNERASQYRMSMTRPPTFDVQTNNLTSNIAELNKRMQELAPFRMAMEMNANRGGALDPAMSVYAEELARLEDVMRKHEVAKTYFDQLNIQRLNGIDAQAGPEAQRAAAEAAQAMVDFRSRYGKGQGQGAGSGQTRPEQAKDVTREAAMQALRDAGGDEKKADELLRQRGYKVP